MQKLTFFFIILLTTTFSVHAQIDKRADTTEDLGMYAFKILKKFENTSDKVFINDLLTIQELKSYVKKASDTVQSGIKEEIEEISIEKYHKKVTKEYTSLKEKAKNYTIVWNAIEYVDFTYKEEKEGIFTGISGKLIFKHNGINYSVKVEAFLINDKYIPFIIRQLSKKAEY